MNHQNVSEISAWLVSGTPSRTAFVNSMFFLVFNVFVRSIVYGAKKKLCEIILYINICMK